MSIRMLAASAALCAAAGAASAATTFTLDFSNFNGSAGNTLQYGPVANDGTTDIFATVDLGPNYVLGAGSNGQTGGDARINVLPGRTFNATLNLFSDAAYSNVYNPMGGFNWAVTVYDIDTNSTGTVVESVQLNTPGTATTGTNAGFAPLDQTVLAGGSVLFTGVRPVPNAAGGSMSLDPNQSNAAIVYEVANTSTINFDFGVSGSGNGRNIFIDGGEIVLEGDTTTDVVPVPLPAGAPLLLAGLGAVAFLRRKR